MNSVIILDTNDNCKGVWGIADQLCFSAAMMDISTRPDSCFCYQIVNSQLSMVPEIIPSGSDTVSKPLASYMNCVLLGCFSHSCVCDYVCM